MTEEDNSTKDRQFVTALARGLDILRCFTPAQPELGTSELARLTNIPQPTVWRLCYTLIHLGYLVPMPGRQTMRPGIPLLGLGQAVLAAHPISEIALPHMLAMARRHEGAVSLGARDGLDMIYLQRCQGSAIILADMRIGSRVPMATSATGWAYIAGLAPRMRQTVFDEFAVAIPDAWAQVKDRLIAALTLYDETGYVINVGSLHSRINSVAVPITSIDGETHLSLSSGGISQIFSEETLPAIGCELRDLAAKLRPMLSFAGT